jgi:AcrR family transcriptional regulator
VRRTQRERSQATIAALVGAARNLFVRDGFLATSLGDIAAAADVTTGALYHHFPSKQALFREIYTREQQTIIDAIIAAAVQQSDPWSGFRAGAHASLTISCRSDVQRITLLDAPGAIGWEAMREIESSSTMKVLERGIQQAIDGGWISPRPIKPLAAFLFGGVCELAMSVAHAKQPRKSKTEASEELDRILDALTVDARPRRSG